jgi:hypothetical protein
LAVGSADGLAAGVGAFLNRRDVCAGDYGSAWIGDFAG